MVFLVRIVLQKGKRGRGIGLLFYSSRACIGVRPYKAVFFDIVLLFTVLVHFVLLPLLRIFCYNF